MVDGTHVVGRDVRPGTYVAMPIGSCYWERTDEDGYIIDNNFSTGARRVHHRRVRLLGVGAVLPRLAARELNPTVGIASRLLALRD